MIKALCTNLQNIERNKTGTETFMCVRAAEVEVYGAEYKKTAFKDVICKIHVLYEE